MNTEISEYAQRLTDNLIHHDYQKYCGLEIVEQRPGYCECRLTVTPAIDNLSHTLHGGVLYSMLDVVSMLATIPALGEGEYALTSSFNTSVMSATPTGQDVVFIAQITRNGRNMIFTQCDAWKVDAKGSRKQIASAQLTKFRLRAELD